jgi:hypothetical protein
MFDAVDVNIELFYSVPEAPLIDAEYTGRLYLYATGGPQGIQNHLL